MALRRETRGWRARFPPKQNEPWATSGGFCGDYRHTRSVQAPSLLTSRIFSSQILAFACLFHTASPGTVGPPKWAKSLPRGAYMAHLVRTNRHWVFERISGLQASGFPVDRFMQVSARSSWRNDFFFALPPPPRPAPSGYRAPGPA